MPRKKRRKETMVRRYSKKGVHKARKARATGVTKRVPSKKSFGAPKVRDETFYPKRNDVLRFKKTNAREMFRDAVGRWYGKSFPNPVLESLIERGEVDPDKGRYLLWVYLSRRTKEKALSSRDTIEPDEALEFPERNEVVSFYAFNDPTKVVGSFKLLYFPEEVSKAGRSAHILIERV